MNLSEVHECKVSMSGGAWDCRRFQSSGSSLVSYRRAVSFHRLLQVVVVGKDLHEEVQLQSLRLCD